MKYRFHEREFKCSNKQCGFTKKVETDVDKVEIDLDCPCGGRMSETTKGGRSKCSRK